MKWESDAVSHEDSTQAAPAAGDVSSRVASLRSSPSEVDMHGARWPVLDGPRNALLCGKGGEELGEGPAGRPAKLRRVSGVEDDSRFEPADALGELHSLRT
jgi:hypothetical protein